MSLRGKTGQVVRAFGLASLVASGSAHAQAILGCGETVSAQLRAGATDTYGIPSVDGATVVIEVADVSGVTGLLRLFGASDIVQEETCTGRLRLPTGSGPSLLRVSDCIGADAGPYTLSLHVISDHPSNCAAPAPCGSTREDAAFDLPGEVDAYQFAGRAGDEISLMAYELRNNMGPIRLRLYDPEGEPVGRVDTCSSTITASLPQDGRYTVLVSACQRPTSGPYRLIFERPECPTGPHVTYFGLSSADDRPLAPVGFDRAGRPIFERPLGQGFSIVLEARPGASRKAVAVRAFSEDRSLLPDLQMLVSRPLGFGTSEVCDKRPPAIGGVPATPDLVFSETGAVPRAVNDLGCRVEDGVGKPEGRRSPLDACTRDPSSGEFRFADPFTTVQFCLPIARAWAFPPGDTIVRARVRDTGGAVGEPREIVVRVNGESSFEISALDPGRLIPFGNRVYFPANDGMKGTELWNSDGTAARTEIVSDLFPGAAGSFPRSLTVFGNHLFYFAQDAPDLWHLWKISPFRETEMVSEVNVGIAVAEEIGLTPVADRLFFFVEAGRGGFELWRSDGTDRGTMRVRVLSLTPGIVDSVAALGDTFFFSFVDVGVNPSIHQLWRSNGTREGTEVVRSFDFTGSTVAVLNELTAVNNTVFFVAGGNRSGGFELWRTDGTAEGTVPLRRFALGADGSPPSNLTALGSLLLFSASDGMTGVEPWRSDGTIEGTTLVRDIFPGAESSRPEEFTQRRGELLFSASAPGVGRELWRTTGTASTTVLVKDIAPGAKSSAPSQLAAVGDLVLFSADDGFTGREVWQSDGTVEGTVLSLDIAPAGASSHPGQYVVAGSRLFFRAAPRNADFSLWTVQLPGLPQMCPADCDGSGAVTVDEVVKAVNIALGSLLVDVCAAADTNGDGAVQIDEIVQAVNFALNGCP